MSLFWSGPIAIHQLAKKPGGGVLSIFSDGHVPFFRVSFSPIISRTWYPKRTFFSEAGCQNMSEGEFFLRFSCHLV